MEEQDIWMLYPTFIIAEGKGIIPVVYLPLDFKERVQRFYEQGRRGDIEEYVTELEKMLAQESLVNSSPEIKLKWDKELGLTNISIGVHGGFDLVDDGNPQFQEHNLSTGNGGIAAYISTKYISELLKS